MAEHETRVRVVEEGTPTYDDILRIALGYVEDLRQLRSTIEIDDQLRAIHGAITAARDLVTDEAIREYVLTAGAKGQYP